MLINDNNYTIMPRNKLLLKLLNSHYQADSLIYIIYKGLDMTVKTDKDGIPSALLIGKRLDNGNKYESYFERESDGGQNALSTVRWRLMCKPAGYWNK